jgi:hypothetical protein
MGKYPYFPSIESTWTKKQKFKDLEITEVASTPSNPPVNTFKIYFKSDGKLYKLNSSGTESQIGGGIEVTSNITIDGKTDTLGDWILLGKKIPSDLTSVTSTVNSDTAVTVAYTAIDSDMVSAVKVEHSPDNSVWTVATTSANATSHQVTGLTPNTNYYFRVTSSNVVGASGIVAGGTARTQIIPNTPTSFALTVSALKPILSWVNSSVGDPTPTYTIARSLSSGTGFTDIITGVSTPYTDTTTANDVTYYYKVKSVNSIGSSAYTSELSVTTSLSSPLVVSNATATYGDPIMRASPTTMGQYFSDPNLQGKTISAVRVWIAKNGTGGNATITCQINGQTIGTSHTSSVGSYGSGGSQVTFSGTPRVTPASAFHINFIMSGYSGSPPSDYCMGGYETGDPYADGYATQSSSQTGSGKDLVLEFDWT